MHRRDFLKRTALSIGAAARLGPEPAQGAGRLPASASSAGLAAQAGPNQRVSLVIAPQDPVASAAPVRWAAQELQRALTEKGAGVSEYKSIQEAPTRDLSIVAAGRNASFAAAALKSAGLTVPGAPECLALVRIADAGRPVLLACGSDARGLMYALLELADRVRHSTEPAGALTIRKPLAERPANEVRSVARLFVSDIEDKPWFNDREMWPAYFAMLAGQRFNRFHLALGIGYDFLRGVTDAYFVFAYPFFLAVPGYNVRAVNLPDAERDSNLETLRFISDQAAARGIEFQLGLWTHGYQWTDSPRANYTIEGLTPENHAAYCRDALAALLRACPAITGVTFRIHGESGVPEGSYSFWQTVFEGVNRCGRKVEIDMHAKGLDQGMIDVGLATGMPLKVSPKYWAEHMGMPYHQAAIRELEMPRRERNDQGFFALSSGSRSFTRYGYADLLREDRRYGVLHRIWPGTQRLLLWGDPATAGAYARAFRFCGSNGVDWMEPLSFKGRRGSGIAGDRCGYADASLRPRWDWQKYLYSYRLWGRLLYNPDADPAVWRRYLESPTTEAALAAASRILPIVTSAHGPSAANNTYWPEMYTNQPIVDAGKKNSYSDTPSPKVFGNVSPFDPQLFSRINDFAEELLKGERTGKYSPVEVAQWLEDLARAALGDLARSEQQAGGKGGPSFRRLAIDIRIQAGLGQFFGAKFRSGVLYAVHERTGDRSALEEALRIYRSAREIWANLAEGARTAYLPDITVGEQPWLRGHWLDRLPAIDDDIADMAKGLASAGASADPRIHSAIGEALGRPSRGAIPCRHTPPDRFHPGQALEIELSVERQHRLASVRVYYRRVNQAEHFQNAEMQVGESGYRAAIPASYTDSPYPLQYYFELKESSEKAWLYPGFTADLANQPYFLVRRAAEGRNS